MDKNNYFNRNRILLFNFLTLLVVIIIILFSTFVLDIKFSLLGQALKSSYDKNNSFWLWIFLLLIFPAFAVWSRIKSFKIKLNEDHIHVKWYDWLAFGFIGFFINAITPFAMGCEPFNIYWLKTKGLSLKRATIIVSSVFIFYPLNQIIVTWPSFFIIASHYSTYAINQEWVVCFWLSFLGLIFDLFSFFFFLSLSYSRRMHVLTNIIWHWIRKKIHISYKTKDEIKYEYKTKASFKNAFIKELKNWKHSLFLFMVNFIYNVLYYSSMIMSLKIMYTQIDTDWFIIFNYVNVSVTANNFIPIPGAEGTLQKLLSTYIISGQDIFIDGYKINKSDDINSLIDNSVFIWRLFSWYDLSTIGLFVTPISIWMGIKYGYNLKINSLIDEIKNFNNNKQLPKIGIIINDNEYSKQIIDIINQQTYDNWIVIINSNKTKNENKKIVHSQLNNNNDLIKIIKKHEIDNFILLDNQDQLFDCFIETSMYLSKNNQDLIFNTYEYKREVFIFKWFLERWSHKTKNKYTFLSKNKLNWYGVIIDAKYFEKVINDFNLYNNHIEDITTLYLMYLMSFKIKYNTKDYRTSNIDTNNYYKNQNELTINLIQEKLNLYYDEKDKNKIIKRLI